jgi:nucleoside-diphosphate-sugar epimerase
VQPQTIAIFGAGGHTGRHAVSHALTMGLDVVAIDLHPPKADERMDGLTYRAANVMEDDLAPAMEGCDAVISALGVAFTPSNALNPPPLYSKGTQRITQAARQAGIKRIAVISAAFVEEQPELPLWFRSSVVAALHNILAQMRKMEAMLEAQPDLDWIAVRPGWLLDKPATGKLLVGDRILPKGAFRCREADLGHFLVHAVTSGEHVHQKPAIGAPEAHEDESLAALGSELAEMAGLH